MARFPTTPTSRREGTTRNCCVISTRIRQIHRRNPPETVTRATIRRFVNALRIIVNIRMTNRGQFPRYFGGSAFRVLVDGQATAPVDGPNEAVASNSDASGDFVFDVPPATRHVILRVIEGSTADVPLDLPPATR